VPEVQVHLRNRLTGVGVDQLDVQPERDTLLLLSDVGADQLARNV
jgi:hypothetical protein